MSGLTIMSAPMYTASEKMKPQGRGLAIHLQLPILRHFNTHDCHMSFYVIIIAAKYSFLILSEVSFLC